MAKSDTSRPLTVEESISRLHAAVELAEARIAIEDANSTLSGLRGCGRHLPDNSE